MKNVVIRAPILSRSGYGEHSRQVFSYLLSKENINVYTQIVPWGITPWYTNSDSCNGLIGEAIKRTAAPDQKFDVSLQVILPNEWDTSAAKFNIGLTAGVETDSCNPSWCALDCNKMDLVIVPSDHTKKSFVNSGGFSTQMEVVPEAYFEELNNPVTEKLDLELSTEFNFLTIGVLTGLSPETDRKNLFYLIKWFMEEFHDDHDVGLIIKTNRGRETTIDKRITLQVLQGLLRELRYTGTPKIYLLHGEMSRSEMNALYRDDKVKALISATRGEGFGLPLLEASVAKLPVIATNWSAHTEFLNRGKWVKVDYNVKPIHEERVDNNIFMKNSRWAEPKEDDFKSSLRKFRKKPELPTEWADQLSSILSEEYSLSSIHKKYDEVLGDILS